MKLLRETEKSNDSREMDSRDARSENFFLFYETRALSILHGSHRAKRSQLRDTAIPYLIPLSTIIYRGSYYIWMGIISSYGGAQRELGK
jgi:hypothetical protein